MPTTSKWFSKIKERWPEGQNKICNNICEEVNYPERNRTQKQRERHANISLKIKAKLQIAGLYIREIEMERNQGQSEQWQISTTIAARQRWLWLSIQMLRPRVATTCGPKGKLHKQKRNDTEIISPVKFQTSEKGSSNSQVAESWEHSADKINIMRGVG